MTVQPMPFHCELASRCSGCSWHQVSYAEQKRLKIEAFTKIWSSAGLPILSFEPNFMSIAEYGLRDRVDLVIDRRTDTQRIGMFDQEHKEIIDLSTCIQLSQPLQSWYTDFRKIKWPIQRGSIRLRVSPQGERGVWLDFANTDVKDLFDEKTILENLLQVATVEIGQRRKLLIKSEDRLRLLDPVLKPWFETYVGSELVPTSLLCHIGGFTQPGFKANRALVNEVMKTIKNLKIRSLAEFGSGIGNFTLPLATAVESIEAFEIDRLSCLALESNLEAAGLKNKVKIHQGDYQNLNEKRIFDVVNFDGIFVDPPRSGLKNFLDPLFHSSKKPSYFMYVSCYPESFCSDSKRLYELGYSLSSVAIIDQFPQTPHVELVASFKRE